MKRLHTLGLFAAAAAMSLALPATAHHSYSMFDMTKTVVLEAKVTQFRWQNPHAFIRVEVPVGGEVEVWSIEMTSPNNLVQEGWTRTSVRQGDRVQLYVHPLRNGARGGSYSGIRLPDGSTLGTVED
ncbi:hypothetical protein GCM10009127_23620 [Alteraurantiacibacter aestuarii]|uniref:DUF6152 family protein n=1 Tax=Alteraurantiacibacter aestuarii TaxID=650004 RepID=UPI0031D40F83